MTSFHEDKRESSPIDAQLAAPPPSYRDENHASQTPSGAGETGTPVADMIQSRGVVLLVLFAVSGALGIPLLWMNQKFSNGERIFWAVVVTIYTVILVAIVCAICIWAYRRIAGI